MSVEEFKICRRSLLAGISCSFVFFFFSFFIFLSSVFLHFPMCRQNLNRWLPFVFVYMQPMAVGNGFLNFLDKSARGRCRYVE